MLDDISRAVLDFEGEHTAHSAAKEDAIREAFEMEPARYYQLLGRLIDDADALAYAPLLVGRLRRLRDGGGSRRANLLR